MNDSHMLAVTTPVVDIKGAWSGSAYKFAQVMEPGAGFSCVLGGEPVGPIPGSEWRVTVESDRDGSSATVLRHSSGLEIRRMTRVMAEFDAVAMYNTWWNITESFDEALLKSVARAAGELGQEYYLLDAGWFASPSIEDGGFITGTGNWWEVHKDKLPGGLKPVGDYVRSQGLKFGLWFEPERVAGDSQLAKEHPDWILRDVPPGAKPWSWTRELNPKMKWVRERSPDTVLEGCASGGRCIDLETARRFHTFLISDSTFDPAIQRFHLHGINHFLPGDYHWAGFRLHGLDESRRYRFSDAYTEEVFELSGSAAMGEGVDVTQPPMSSRVLLYRVV